MILQYALSECLFQNRLTHTHKHTDRYRLTDSRTDERTGKAQSANTSVLPSLSLALSLARSLCVDPFVGISFLGAIEIVAVAVQSNTEN